MKAYLAIKFREDFGNREMVEGIAAALREKGIEMVTMVDRGEEFSPQELMRKTFEEIDGCELMLVEFSEKGVGLGIEAGYAHAKGKPIFVIAREGSDISSTLRAIAKEVIFYKSFEEIVEIFKFPPN